MSCLIQPNWALIPSSYCCIKAELGSILILEGIKKWQGQVYFRDKAQRGTAQALETCWGDPWGQVCVTTVPAPGPWHGVGAQETCGERMKSKNRNRRATLWITGFLLHAVTHSTLYNRSNPEPPYFSERWHRWPQRAKQHKLSDPGNSWIKN